MSDPFEKDVDVSTEVSNASGRINNGKWAGLISGIESGERRALEDFYILLIKATRGSFSRHLGVESSIEKVHDTFIAAVQAIQSGDLKDSERLMGFVKGISFNKILKEIEARVKDRRRSPGLDEVPLTMLADRTPDPEQNAMLAEKKSDGGKTLGSDTR